MLVLKFGGTSVGSSESLLKVLKIIGSKSEACVVIVSAMNGITDSLAEMFEISLEKGEGYMELLDKIRNRHFDIIREVVPFDRREDCMLNINALFCHLEEILNCITVLKESSKRSRDFVMSFGELFTAHIVVAMLENADFVDARDIIVTDNNFGAANVIWEESKQKIKDKFEYQDRVKLVNGFCGKTRDGYTSSLGRGGSDLSASLIAAALGAECLEIWTDVNGMMTADPRIEPNALTIPRLKYNEAAELSHFGAKVIYTPALWPAIKADIPVYIKNTFDAAKEGTIIDSLGDIKNDEVVKGISSIHDMSLITLCGNGLMGDIGFAGKLFSLMSENKVNIVLISQASSEYSITFAVRGEDSDKAVLLIRNKFSKEFSDGIYSGVLRQDGMAIVAVVGDNMRNVPGRSGKVFSVLGKNSVNINAIAQGASESSISFVISMNKVNKVIRVLHDSFFLGGELKLDVYLAGIGSVGSALIKQIDSQKEYIKKEYKVDISVKGLINSSKMLVSDECLINRFNKGWKNEASNSELREFIDIALNSEANNKIFVDCTASKEIAEVYVDLLSSGISVVTANKIAASGDYDYYQKLISMGRSNGCSFRNETNVGAGLPVLQTIEDMVKSGDRIYNIDAVLSGSLNYIFNKLGEGMGLYEAIKGAKELGFTEPDPRIDLSGLDVKRKLLILSRVAGYKLEASQVREKMFLPMNIFETVDIEQFWEEVKLFEKEFEERLNKIFIDGKRLRYVASFKEGKAEIGLMEVDSSHPFFDLDDSNNIVMIKSERYKKQPLIIKGYGAGAEVTAAGVFADIMKSVIEN